MQKKNLLKTSFVVSGHAARKRLRPDATRLLMAGFLLALLPLTAVHAQDWQTEEDMAIVKWKPADADFIRADTVVAGGIRYLLAAARDHGVFMARSDYPGQWFRPHGVQYPREWWLINVRDAAFWTGKHSRYARKPEDEFIVLLDKTDRRYMINRSGIYCWNTFLNNFTRVDQPRLIDPGKVFTRIYHHKTDRDILYVTADDGIYKLTGPYGDLNLEKLPDTTTLDDLDIEK